VLAIWYKVNQKRCRLFSELIDDEEKSEIVLSEIKKEEKRKIQQKSRFSST
jgi:hypothetical protein